MIDHVSIGVANLASATAFYKQVLGALGFEVLVTLPETVGFGKRYPEFWLNHRPQRADGGAEGAHICLRCDSVDALKRFHQQALAGAAVDDGAPGLRPHYAANYYAAFIVDADGNRIEAVTYIETESSA